MDKFIAEKISVEFIRNHFTGKYWESCAKFVDDNWFRRFDSFTPKQLLWIDRILDDCVEKRIEG